MHLELRGITKTFPGVLANDSVDLSVASGEILGLLGENGAGKTTLMNILYGLHTADEGDIVIDGVVQDFTGPEDAIGAGIGMVHQHFMLVPVMTVAENVILGVEPIKPRRFPWLASLLAMAAVLMVLAVSFEQVAIEEMGWGAVVLVAFVAWLAYYLTRDAVSVSAARGVVVAIGAKYGLEVDPDARIEDLPVGTQQRVEVMKVLYREADVIVFDEPTSVLTPQEVTEFLDTLRALRDAGKAIIFITHKLKEIQQIADRIAVLRRGKVVGTAESSAITQDELAELMVGRPVELVIKKASVAPGEVILDVARLSVLSDRGQLAVNDVSFCVRSGEIVGVAGVQGNGQTELVEALAGLRPAQLGSIQFRSEDVTGATPRDLHDRGVAHIPEDRQRSGLVMDFSVGDNMVLNSYYANEFSRGLRMRWKRVAAVAEELVESYDVRTPSTEVLASSLSGGNQQKVIVAREFSRHVSLVLASQPTRGVDVGSIEYIHGRIVEKRDAGAALLIVSTELDEVMALSDRILVMFDGRIVAETTPEGTSSTQLGLYMAGSN